MATSVSANRLDFIGQTLRAAAAALARLGAPSSRYTDVKGYLADADLAADEAIRSAIRKEFPEDVVYSEEENGQRPSSPSRSGACTWIVDPICGTTNYVRGIPLFVHSLCVMDEEGIAAAGIYHAAMDELFLADRTKTTLNGRTARVSQTSTLSEAVVSFNCNQSSLAAPSPLETIIKRLAPPVTRRLKILESANLELAYVACGRLDGYINPEDKVWDIAAGSLMIASAGGRLAVMKGSIRDLALCRGVVAGNAAVFDQLKEKALGGGLP